MQIQKWLQPKNMTNAKNENSKLEIEPRDKKWEQHAQNRNSKKQNNNDKNVTNPTKIQIQEHTQKKDNLHNRKR